MQSLDGGCACRPPSAPLWVARLRAERPQRSSRKTWEYATGPAHLIGMELLYRILADVVVVLHAAYVLFVIVGLLAVLLGRLRSWQWTRGFWFRIVHLAMMLVVVAETWLGITCPLTTWETALRRRAGQAGYEGDFIARFVHDLLFYDAPDWVFTASYTAFGLLVVASFVLAPPRWPEWRRRVAAK